MYKFEFPIISKHVLILDFAAVGEKIFRLEIGYFSNFYLFCRIDKAENFDEHYLGSTILLILSMTHFFPNVAAENVLKHVATFPAGY